jgi:signal transduction histidine kinase
MIPLRWNRTHPLRFLLYLEWILLGVLIFSEAFAVRFLEQPRLPMLNLFCLVVFGLMGLKLPNNHWLSKFFYTSVEFALILLASSVGGVRFIAFLYVILLSRNCLIFNRKTRSVVNALTIVVYLFTQADRLRYLNLSELPIVRAQLGFILLAIGFLLAMLAIFMQLMINALFSERESRQKLATANEQLAIANAQLREYALKVEQLATLEERNRIARDIHDSVGHALTILNLHLEAALKLWQSNPQEATEFLTEAKQLGTNALQEVRQSITTLRTDTLQGETLGSAISQLTQEFYRSTGILPICHINLQRSVPAEVKTAVYRIVQETLTNICKHAKATEVSIHIDAVNQLDLIIQDNGLGFNVNQNKTGFGLQGMRERTLSLNGVFEVISVPGAGCKIIAQFPL